MISQLFPWLSVVIDLLSFPASADHPYGMNR
jgi:hypothetical protein